MNDAISRMLAKYRLETLDDHLRALREILQEIALLGLWRSKFFEHGAFYGGTALRILPASTSHTSRPEWYKRRTGRRART